MAGALSSQTTADPAEADEPGEPADTATGPSRRLLRITFLGALVAFFLMSAGWAVGLPVNGTYDENQHILRAYAAGSGQLYAKPVLTDGYDGAVFDIPKSLLPAHPSCTWKDRAPATCQAPTSHDSATARTATTAGRYNPLYYIPVGLPMVISPNFAGIVGGRLVSGLMSALLLAAAVVTAVRLRSRLMVGAVVLVATPMALDLAGSINPNGLEISSGVLLWTALLGLGRAPDGVLDHRATRRLLLLAAISAGLLLSIRTLGPLFVALIVVGALLLARRGRIRAILRRRDFRWMLLGVAVVAVYAAAWTLFSGILSTDVTPGHANAMGLGSAVKYIVGTRVTFWVNQIVGQFSYGETTVPSWFITCWYVLVGALVIPAAALARRRQALVLIGIAAGSLLILTAFELKYLHTLGWSQHSRYVMPFGVGLLLAAATLTRFERTIGALPASRLVRLFAVATAPLQLYALAKVMNRFEVGPSGGFSPFAHGWRPPLGPVTPIAAALLGAAALIALVWWLTRPRPGAPLADGPASAQPA
jgi:predicted membrane protein DUF2142